MYSHVDNEPRHLLVAYQKLSLVFIVLAFGTTMNMELPPGDPRGHHYFVLSQQCLFTGKVMPVNSIVGVQVLVSGRVKGGSSLSEYHGEIRLVCCAHTSVPATPTHDRYTDLRWGNDLAWQIWGIAGRLVLGVRLLV